MQPPYYYKKLLNIVSVPCKSWRLFHFVSNVRRGLHIGTNWNLKKNWALWCWIIDCDNFFRYWLIIVLTDKQAIRKSAWRFTSQINLFKHLMEKWLITMAWYLQSWLYILLLTLPFCEKVLDLKKSKILTSLFLAIDYLHETLVILEKWLNCMNTYTSHQLSRSTDR